MSSVEHGEVDYHASKKAALKHSQEEARSNESSERLGEAEKGAYESPADQKEWQISARFEVLHDPIRRDIDEDIRYVENHEGNVELVAG